MDKLLKLYFRICDNVIWFIFAILSYVEVLSPTILKNMLSSPDILKQRILDFRIYICEKQ